jgi:hypothetical protein
MTLKAVSQSWDGLAKPIVSSTAPCTTNMWMTVKRLISLDATK